MAKNPYTLVFWKKPSQIISRTGQSMDIVETFDDDDPSQQIYMITGVRGSGKTVFMTEVATTLERNDDWIVVELNPEKDLLEQLASILCSQDRLARIFQKAKINLSFFGIGLVVDGVAPITNIEVAITRILESLKKDKKKLLITIDEVTNSKSMREFAAAFQIFVRKDLPTYLLMTGLYNNISRLENEKSLTFLHRAPKIHIKPLGINIITDNYMKVLGVDKETAHNMASMTKGYSFAFQVLGYYAWAHENDLDAAIPEYKQYLYDYVYDKIWSEISAEDKRVLSAIADSEDGRIIGIRNKLGMETNQFNPYRDRLKKYGIINGDTHGYVTLVLPLFDEYISDKEE